MLTNQTRIVRIFWPLFDFRLFRQVGSFSETYLQLFQKILTSDMLANNVYWEVKCIHMFVRMSDCSLVSVAVAASVSVVAGATHSFNAHFIPFQTNQTFQSSYSSYFYFSFFIHLFCCWFFLYIYFICFFCVFFLVFFIFCSSKVKKKNIELNFLFTVC